MGIADAALAERPGRVADQTDQQLVTAVRHGDERAFETLYSRYQRRIAAYVYGMVKDYGRAEDITQEVFVSALRRMRQTERPIAFRPWVYEIAKNACIDAYRRGQRAEEVSFDADDRLSPGDYGRLVATEPEPDALVDTKQELDHLCGAFGGLSDAHHQILVMREFEGLSYQDIGERLGMSRGAVESTLFRARKRLGEEYDELASGARCLRVQAIIANAGESRLGLRDQRRLARHVSHCQPCRRLAAQSGLDIPVPVRTRVAGKIAAWLPIPAFLRLRRGGGGDDVASAAGGSGWVLHGPALAESMHSGWSKAIAGVAALLVAGAGVGVTTSSSGGSSAGGQRAPHRTAAQRVAPAGHAPVAAAAGTGGNATHPAPAHGGGSNPAAPASSPVKDAAAKAPKLPKAHVPAVAGGQGGQAVDNVTQTVDHAAQNVTNTVTQPGNVVPNVAHTVDDAVQDAGATVDGAVDDVSNTVDGLLKP